MVEVDGGYATLSGIVKSQAERRRADILARALGAVGVDNRLRLEAETQEPHSDDDEELRRLHSLSSLNQRLPRFPPTTDG